MASEKGSLKQEACGCDHQNEKSPTTCSSFAAVLLHIKEHSTERISDFFAWWAAMVFDYPYSFIIGTLLCVSIMCIGFIPGIPVWIDGAEALYSLPYSTARSQGAVHKVLFNETSARPSFVLVTGQTPGENIFTWDHLEAVLQLDQLIRGKIVDPKHGRRLGIARKDEYNMNINERSKPTRPPKKLSPPIVRIPPSNGTLGSTIKNEDGAPTVAEEMIGLVNNATLNHPSPEKDRGDAGLDILTFQDICARNSFRDCQVSGILEMGVFDLRSFLPPGAPPTLFLFDGLVFNAKKKAFPPHFLLGHAEEVPCSPELPKSLLSLVYSEDQLMEGGQAGMARANMTCITRVEAFQLIYEIADRNIWSKRNEDWERVFVDVMSDNVDFGPLKISMNAFRSRDDALRASTSESSDVLFVAFTFALLVAYSTSLNFSCDLYRSKSYPALSGVVASILGMIAGMGLMSLCGIAFVPTALVCPFLVVGVGVDDMFVIINCYSLAYMVDSARDRCILSLRDTGLAITITTTTSLISFIIGLNTGYLSIKNFCWFCGAGMFFGFIFVLTFFFAFHCLDAKREEENMACLFFVPSNERREARRQELRSEGVEFSKKADITTFTLGALMVRRHEQDALRRYALRLHRNRKEAEATKGGKLLLKDDHQKEAGLTYSETQETVETLSPDMRDITDTSYINEQQQKKKKKTRGCFHWLRQAVSWWHDKLEAGSDALLARIALEGHRIAKERGLHPNPSNGIFEFEEDDTNGYRQLTGDPLIDILHRPEIPLYYYSTTTGEKKLFIMEPKGSVGLIWRRFLIRFYGPLLIHPICKTLVVIFFGVFLAVGLYGCSQLKSGLDLKDLAPPGSYLNQYDQTLERSFGQYDFPVDIFFPEFQQWWSPDIQQSMRDLEIMMRKTGSGKLVMNPLIRMLDDPELIRGLQSGEQEMFEKTLYNALALENGKYKQFEQNFVWEGSHLRAWKMQILPGVMKTSADRAAWMTQIRQDCLSLLNRAEPIVVMSYNYMMTFYESDLQINSSVTSNMIVAAITMLLVAMVAIPQLMAGFLVILIMGMIDIGIIGFMYLWNVKLNMVSMICLLLSVGFSVDFSAHVCHTYMDAEGQTRNQRAVECLVIMGNPVFHGAASSILGVLMLGFSSSYIFRVFFKMMTLVTVFALVHSVVFLPVLLSIVGGSAPHNQQRRLKEEQQRQRPKSVCATRPPSPSPDQEQQQSSEPRNTDATVDVSRPVYQDHRNNSNNNNNNELFLPSIRSRQHQHHSHYDCPVIYENRSDYHPRHYRHHHQLVQVLVPPGCSPTESSHRCRLPHQRGRTVLQQQRRRMHATGATDDSQGLTGRRNEQQAHKEEGLLPSSRRNPKKARRICEDGYAVSPQERTPSEGYDPSYQRRSYRHHGDYERRRQEHSRNPNTCRFGSDAVQREQRTTDGDYWYTDACDDGDKENSRIEIDSSFTSHRPQSSHQQYYPFDHRDRWGPVSPRHNDHHVHHDEHQNRGFMIEEKNEGLHFPQASSTKNRPATTAAVGKRMWREPRHRQQFGYYEDSDDCYDYDARQLRVVESNTRQSVQRHNRRHQFTHDWKTPRSSRRQQSSMIRTADDRPTEEWVDEECRIEMPEVSEMMIPTEKIDWTSGETIVVRGSEIASPERLSKSPVIRRKQQQQKQEENCSSKA